MFLMPPKGLLSNTSNPETSKKNTGSCSLNSRIK